MQSNGKKILSVLLALILALGVLPASLAVSAAESDAAAVGDGPGPMPGERGIVDPDYPDYEYIPTDDGAEITYYNGDGGDITIPSHLGGYPVTKITTFAPSRPVASSLTSIVIPDTVKSIGEKAFSGCRSLKKVAIPDTVTKIRGGAFEDCESLESITVDPANTVYDSRDNCNAIIETATDTLIYGYQNTVIPDTVTVIGDNAFENCNGLTSIVIPDSVTEIGGEAFSDCTGLKNVKISDSVTKIGWRAFSGCTSLTSITIPASVEEIEGGAFAGTLDNEDFTMYGYYGTGADRYAAKESIRFIGLNEIPASKKVAVDVPKNIACVVRDVTAKPLTNEYGWSYDYKKASPDEASISADEDIIGVYEVTLWGEDHRVSTADEAVTVRIRCSQPDAKAYMFRYGTPKNVNATYEGGWLTFTTDRFTTYSSAKICVTASAGVELPACGDFDGDDDITSVDATFIQRSLAGMLTDIDKEVLIRGDVDGDGEFEITDATYIQRYLAKIETPYPIGEYF